MHMLIYHFNSYVNYRRHLDPCLVTCTGIFCFETFETFLVPAQFHCEKVRCIFKKMSSSVLQASISITQPSAVCLCYFGEEIAISNSNRNVCRWSRLR